MLSSVLNRFHKYDPMIYIYIYKLVLIAAMMITLDNSVQFWIPYATYSASSLYLR